MHIDSSKRWLIVIAVMSATLMQVIDTTIINVALPHMQGELNAAPDQISWTLTSYLVASAIFMPLTGYCSDKFGQKKYLLFCIAGFTVASACCGAAQSLSQLVLFRLLQGACGAALVPLSQSILTEIFSLAERGKAMAIWGAGIMTGPILGPTLGGYLTEFFSWRWNFYVNLPLGIFALILAWQTLPSTAKKDRKIDWIGLTLLSLAIGTFQYFLDQGNQYDWFEATRMQLAAVICVGTLLAFIILSIYRNKQRTLSAVFDMKILQDRNFVISSLLLAALGLGIYGTMIIQPLLLETLLNYPVITTGIMLAPRGISSMLAMILVGRIVNKYDPRIITGIGIIICIIGIAGNMYYSENIDVWWIIWPSILQGFGIGMVFVPLSVLAFSTLAPHHRTEAAGLYSLLRTLGSSIGIAITMTFFTRHSQIAWNSLAKFITPYSPAVNNYLAHLHINLASPGAATVLASQLTQQAQMLAMVNTFAFIMFSFILMLPLLFCFKIKPPKH